MVVVVILGVGVGETLLGSSDVLSDVLKRLKAMLQGGLGW